MAFIEWNGATNGCLDRLTLVVVALRALPLPVVPRLGGSVTFSGRG